MRNLDVFWKGITARTTPGTVRHAWLMARASYDYSRWHGLSIFDALQGAWELFWRELRPNAVLSGAAPETTTERDV